MTDVLPSYSDFDQPFSPDIQTSHWTRECADQISPRPENTVPPFDTFKVKTLMPGYHAWDSWFALTEDGKVAEIEGFKILLALARPLTETPEGQNPYQRRPSDPRERIAYFYTKDGVHYHVGGSCLIRRCTPISASGRDRRFFAVMAVCRPSIRLHAT